MSEDYLQKAYEGLTDKLGKASRATPWFEITQQQINAFADATLDRQWIHIDQQKAQAGPFGQPVAHGHLTLALMNHLPDSEHVTQQKMAGQKLAINYGFNRVRFPAPVKVGAKIRRVSVIKSAQIKGRMIEIVSDVTVEIQGHDKPAVVAQSLTRLVF